MPIFFAELFFEDREHLLFELDTVIASLCEYRDALNDGDRERMTELLREGRICKEKVDG